MGEGTVLLLVIVFLLASVILTAAVPAWIAAVATPPGEWRWAALTLAFLVGEAAIHRDIIQGLFGIGFDGTCPREWKFATREPCLIEEWRSLIFWSTSKAGLLPAPGIWWLRAIGSGVHLAAFAGFVVCWSRRGVPLHRGS